MIRLLVLSAGLLMWSQARGEAIEEQYLLSSYPDVRGNCFQVAEELGQRFAAQYNVAVDGSECLDHTAAGYTIAINLPAGLGLNLVSTGNNMFNINGRGQYPGREICEADISRQEALFEGATGLKPFVSYCYKGRYLSDLPWGMRIDAIGSPLTLPYNQHSYIFGSLVGNDAAFTAKFKEAVRPFGATERQLVFGRGIELGSLSFYYFAEQAIDTEVQDISVFDSPEECAESLALAEGVEAAESVDRSLWFCSKGDFSGKAKLHRMHLYPEVLKVEETIERHASAQVCRDSIPETINQYRSHRGLNIHGAFCGRPVERDLFSTVWKVMLITD